MSGKPKQWRGVMESGWRLYGTKWFTSATTADMALTLARPEGNPPGGRGLAMFYLELRDENGRFRTFTSTGSRTSSERASYRPPSSPWMELSPFPSQGSKTGFATSHRC